MTHWVASPRASFSSRNSACRRCCWMVVTSDAMLLTGMSFTCAPAAARASGLQTPQPWTCRASLASQCLLLSLLTSLLRRVRSCTRGNPPIPPHPRPAQCCRRRTRRWPRPPAAAKEDESATKYAFGWTVGVKYIISSKAPRASRSGAAGRSHGLRRRGSLPETWRRVGAEWPHWAQVGRRMGAN